MRKSFSMGIVAAALMLTFGVAQAEESTLIGFGYVGPVADEGWTWSHDQGREYAQEQLDGKIKTVFVESMPFSDEVSRILEQFVADGAKMVITNSEYADFVSKVSNRHPKIAFMECSGHIQTNNKISFYTELWDPSYLIGMMAGLLSKTGNMGFVGSYPVPALYDCVNGFMMGARAVNPKATMKVVLINSWFDPSKAKQAAEALISDGCDFLFGIMDEAAYLQVAEKEGIWAAMMNTDIRRFGQNAYVSSVIFDWRQFYEEEIKKILDGTWTGNRIVLLPIGKGVDRDTWGKNVPKVYQWMVDAVRDKMLEGWSPFVGPIKDKEGKVRVPVGEKLAPGYMYDKWNWSVEGVSGLPN